MSALARLLRARDGAAAVEAAMILPALLLLLLGALEIGRFAWMRAGLQFAVQEAARCAAVQPTICSSPADTQAYAAAKIPDLKIPASDFTVTTPSCGTQVQASVPYSYLVFSVFPSAPTLTAQTCRS
jgi:Flp pilus assembly protein TadG